MDKRTKDYLEYLGTKHDITGKPKTHQEGLEWRNLITSLQSLGSDMASRIFGTAISRRWCEDWVQLYGLVLMPRFDLQKLIGHSVSSSGLPSCSDHLSMWAYQESPRIPVVGVSEPYGVTSKELAELLDYCNQFGLQFTIDTCSPHFPSATLHILLWRTDNPLRTLKERGMARP